MGSDGNCRSYLLLPIVEVHVSDVVLWRMDVRVVLVFPVFDLQDCGQSLLTEGNLVTSRAAGDHPLVQVELVCVDCFAHDLGQGDRGWMSAMD